ncbi:MAG TPA: sigma-54 dependent transcriptional regulator [Candidatus Acidoferrales bacterium]|nr:sigma-54 dependent transcriptional regulator [Candidatus Acidoferrales bacterium]
MATKILVVDDDRNLLELIRMRLETADYEVSTALNERDALEAVKSQVFDLSIVDLRLMHQDGLELMEQIHLVSPDLPVIILTAHGSIENAVEAMKKGAYSYITKPFEPRDLLFQIEKALENRRLASEIQRLKDLLAERYDFANIIAKSDKMQAVLEAVSRIAKTESTVYLQGESGTGKEVIAKAIHLASDRKDKAFVAINCAAIPETLLESELFGHEKGAFTGAVRSTKGLFTQAHEGTLFLDEIGEMPLSIQAKLLRALEERQFYPIGSEKPVRVDVRVIVATKKDLEEEVKKGEFREDLFYRIHVIPIRLPPLRERKEDIPHLVDHFLKKVAQQMKKTVKGVSPHALQKLMLHDWPGNVRELENTIEYAVAMTQHEIIGEEYILQTKAAPHGALKPLKEAKESFEREYLVNLLQVCEGNVSRAAKIAGKYRADFYDLLRKHSLRPQDYKE